MYNIDSKFLNLFIKKAQDRLSGKWIVIGGTVLPLINIDHRVTLDIDMFSLESNNNESTLQLMTLSREMNLPVETINPAGIFFLNQIENWKSQLVLVHKKNNFELYRPDINLFLILKIKRLTEIDLSDCLVFLKNLNLVKDKLDKKLVTDVIKEEILKASSEKIKRLKYLLTCLG